MGNPDLPTPPHVIEKLKETLGKPRTDRYSASRGITGLRRAQAAYYERRFGVKLNPETQIVATLGSKEGFANVAQAITAPGDVVLVPNPSYPIHAFGFLMAGGVVRSVPAEPTPELFAHLERAIIHSIPKPIAMIACYPSNPTAYVASLDFYKDLVAFAKKHEIFILSDLAYAELYYDGVPPPSVLQVPGAIDITVEFTSMSKTFSMAGWRMGFAVGNERIIAALTRVKSYLDYGAFTPVQVAATAALNGPQDCIKEMRDTYRKRRDALVESFGRAGWDIPPPAASMFAWAPLPEKFKDVGSMAFATLMVEKSGHQGSLRGCCHRWLLGFDAPADLNPPPAPFPSVPLCRCALDQAESFECAQVVAHRAGREPDQLGELGRGPGPARKQFVEDGDPGRMSKRTDRLGVRDDLLGAGCHHVSNCKALTS